jgi:hypothetical protein
MMAMVAMMVVAVMPMLPVMRFAVTMATVARILLVRVIIAWLMTTSMGTILLQGILCILSFRAC